ncbi:MAG: Ni,Fe-hydrogenase III large subunit [Gammaproteobacteria bacterium]|nr:Ni,Fe-hydrogenase III large subunit [Gammaproteobacteria bacterium]
MNRFDWLPELANRCQAANIDFTETEGPLGAARQWAVAPSDWGRMAQAASEQGCRWSALWAEQIDDDRLRVSACVCLCGDYLVLRTHVPLSAPELPSQTPWYPAANRPERHARDLYGVVFTDHPDPRRWMRHQAWDKDQFPLRRDFPVAGTVQGETPPDADYPFLQAQGAGVYEIPVGPVHAGIIEPGHFRFQAVGEMVLNLEERLGYVHKGIEKIAEGRDAAGLARLASRVSGDCAVAHAWAACMAMEQAAGVDVPARALVLRAILAERERIANHLGDIGAICNDVSFVFAHSQFLRLRELWQRGNQELFGHRLLMDGVVPGGTAVDLDDQKTDALRAQCEQLTRELNDLLPIIDDHPPLEERLVGSGILSSETARVLGAVGYVGKASGIDFDLRRDHGYAPYDQLHVPSPCQTNGDVESRLQVRVDEIRYSLELIAQLLQRLPEGPSCVEWRNPESGGEGLGLVEGWRGEIVSYVRFDETGHVARFFPRDPSWLNWPALEQLIHDNIVPEFPVCNKSVNGSYSGHDL